jgi:hypothetical protein
MLNLKHTQTMRKLFAILMIGLLTIVGAQSVAASREGPPGVSVEMTYTPTFDQNSTAIMAIDMAFISPTAISREVEYVIIKPTSFISSNSILYFKDVNETQPVPHYWRC